ncbi:MAG TPA: VacJ family lipoprotein [Nitrosomonas mobilis]|uniref:VacJ family lipoprotein n=1 Tax=Nitrosomonas mobilis TaxID=51642 RepID=A0A1G5SJE1_9PROT|nr:VacJ family lipoprotein [Nitrosomonas mobilis]HNO76247.1 VacJ family lipoprotein [Nitrosomonas mobilis]
MINKYLLTIIRLLILLLSFGVLTGCSLAPKQQDKIIPAQRTLSDNEDITYPMRIYDPWEGFNRSIYKFNAKFDQYVFLPVVQGYEFIMPKIAQTGINNFFSNLSELSNLINSILQLKPKSSLHALSRFLINSTLGIAGLWNHASTWGILEYQEDFGQTLGHYGVGDGPYLVVPIMGPMNARDGFGLLVDSLAYNVVYWSAFNFSTHQVAGATFSLTRAINMRKQTKFRYYQSGSPFEYDLVRYLYTQSRKLEIAK